MEWENGVGWDVIRCMVEDDTRRWDETMG
jgi:hypothetical protein